MPIERTGMLAAGVPLFARWVGDGGPTVVVLHGGPGASQDYLRPQFDALATGRTLLYYDQRGGGRSGTPCGVALGWREHVGDLEAVLGSQHPAPACLLGFSWGGLLALLFALEHPGAVRRLALVAPAPTYPDARKHFDEAFAAWQGDARVTAGRALLSASGLRDRDPDAFRRRAFELSVAGYFKHPDRAPGLTPFRVAFRAQQAAWESLRGMDLRDRLRDLDADVLIAHGRYDPVPLEASEVLVTRLPRARLVVFEDSGHAPYVEETERFVEVFDGFLPKER